MIEKVKAILIDDEKNSREVLSFLLAKNHPEIEVIAEANDAESAFHLCQLLKPQLVFLDIQMPRANGFSFLKMFDEINFEVIFVTSYDQYALTAIKFNALDYLLKPVDISDLNNAINRATSNIRQKLQSQALVINLLHNLDTDIESKTFAIHDGNKVKMISEKSILYIEANGRYCNLTMNSGETYTAVKNLKEFEEYFGTKSTFIRISKTYMINALYIDEYTKGEPFIINMVNEKSFEVSRRKKPSVLDKLRLIK